LSATQDLYQETGFQVRAVAGPLLGVVCSPNRPLQKSSLFVIIVAGQPQTRVGPHRMFVELARHLAEEGIRSLRFDCSGWGDSPGPTRSFEESRFDIVTVVQSVLREDPDQQVVIVGLCDGATAALLSLPLLKADHRKVIAMILINPWIDQEQFEAAAESPPNDYSEQLKSTRFWGKLLGRGSQGGSTSALALQSSKGGRQISGKRASDLSLTNAIQGSNTKFLAVLSSQDLSAKIFSKWLDQDEKLKQSFSTENTLMHPRADHTFSDGAHWREACHWISQRLNQIVTAR
jgi:uncharacterized protein